ncbi:Predicted metalloprotease, contains C-terminal PDZ domain [Aromatoleum tolulyticum]|uniref:Predicted metalloprotease, contains C-terminal PDZ domain n=1 Tax=Aromatoleum tolulyticum TaxID=34027 RepID=A0A1N6XP16_9RHOO|nr:PDZ domain-containing protein [Aromatoleum tolulyticum]SIR04115.1 Predicted metalloprotease, contains C-terminal PDZ domain [Aromatoleum tolulyticum]
MPHQPRVSYAIAPARPEAHVFEVTCTVAAPDPAGQVFRLPAWIPGSYMIREFARNIVTLRAECNGRPVAVEKLDKHSWRAAPVEGGRVLTLSYEVYAWDLSVRTAHLDATHGFFNGTSVFLAVEGKTDEPCYVDILPPDGPALHTWKVATTLRRPAGDPLAAPAMGFGLYRAENYDELVDHPVEMGCFTHGRFEAAGVPHDVVLTGRHDCDLERLCADLSRICTWQIELFGTPAPVDRYLFLTMVVGDGYGGLEHRASTALLTSRNDLPYVGMREKTDGYLTFLGLCSHEYFHTWNVKRIKPAAFAPYDLATENYTRLLWAFEGFTSYYDDLALVRSGVIGVEDYLVLLGKTMSNVLRGSGRLKQSVAESSFDAWIKYYRQDENAPNAIVSYYAKGALIALALDLQLRAASAGRKSLDDVMRLLWQRHGLTGEGVAEDGLFALVGEVAEAGLKGAGRRLSRWLKDAVEGTEDLPLDEFLRPFGIEFRTEAAVKGGSLGVKLAGGNGEAKLANVFDDGPGQRCGLSAGDVLVAVDGLKVTAASLDGQLARRRPGEQVTIHAFRRDELMTFTAELAAPPADTVKLASGKRVSAPMRTLREGWLGS